MTGKFLDLVDKHGKEDCFRHLVCEVNRERVTDPAAFTAKYRQEPLPLVAVFPDVYELPSVSVGNITERAEKYYEAKESGEDKSKDCNTLYSCTLSREDILEDAKEVEAGMKSKSKTSTN